MNRIRVEFTTEPFVIGRTPEHAKAAEMAAAGAGLETEFGPFGTSAVGDRAEVMAALPAIVEALALSDLFQKR